MQSETGHAGISTRKPNSIVLNVQGLYFISLLSTCIEHVEPPPPEARLSGVEWWHRKEIAETYSAVGHS